MSFLRFEPLQLGDAVGSRVGDAVGLAVVGAAVGDRVGDMVGILGSAPSGTSGREARCEDGSVSTLPGQYWLLAYGPGVGRHRLPVGTAVGIK